MTLSNRSLILLLASTVCAVLGGATLAVAQDYRPSFHPDQLKGPPAGAPNEVLVLGTPHLSGLGDGLRPQMLAPLMDRLAAWSPTAIATEDLSGLQCDALRRYPSRYASTVESYCWDPAPANAATGLDAPAANAEAERLLDDWPAQPSPAQRRRLAALFLAAGERGSALVQWLRLEASDQTAGDGLTDALVEVLNGIKDRRNETYMISAPLAARLGLERLWAVDDHSADDPTDPTEKEAYGAAIMRAWDNPATHARQAADAQIRTSIGEEGGVLQAYRAYNAPEAPALAFQSDFGAALMEPSPQSFGRGYLGYWETRNLRMGANMRDVLGRYPGARMLAIVGASHKGYYEAYLDQMHDVRLVDSEVVLR